MFRSKRAGRRLHPWLAALPVLLAAVLVAPALADDLGDDEEDAELESPFASVRDPRLRHLLELDRIAPFEDRAPLWDYVDADLQRGLDRALNRLDLGRAAAQGELAIALVDITELEQPRVAAVNGDQMVYAASLPKIAVLLAAFEKIAEGRMKLDLATRANLQDMIRSSSNTAATALMRKVGKDYIARTLLSPRYRLYDPSHNGGLWAGKDYAKSGLWMRDPLHNLSHGATAMQVARFYYLLETGNLVTPEHSAMMKSLLADSSIKHKFVKGLKTARPRASVYRKSGSWRSWHSDSAIVEREGVSYIAVALSEHPRGGTWLSHLIVELDGLIDTVRMARGGQAVPASH